MQSFDLTNLTDEQLIHKGMQLEREMMNSRFRHYTQQLEDTSSLKKLRRNIARVQTAVRARELERGLRRNALRDQYASSFVVTAPVAVESSGGFLAGLVDKAGEAE